MIVETANDAVVSADESGAIQFANPATKRVFGYEPAELIGKPLTVLMPEFMRKSGMRKGSRAILSPVIGMSTGSVLSSPRSTRMDRSFR